MTLSLRTRITAAALVVPLAAVAACGSRAGHSSSTSASGAASATKAALTACMVTDLSGIDDKSFNASAWAGLQAAQSAGKASVRYVQSKTEADYATNISSLLNQKCSLVLTVGGLMATATQAAAKANPSQRFAEVDAAGNGSNVQGVLFNIAQASFLAGYLAAGYSKSGIVAEFGGLKIPPVTTYMDGFWEGVQYYNQKKGAHVRDLGWDEKTQSGVFAGSFNDQTKGSQLTTNFAQQGADVVFPVAGSVQIGVAATAEASGGKIAVVWADTDGCVADPQYCSVFLTSTLKNISPAVQKVVDDQAAGLPPDKDYIGTLANNGVGIAPLHQFSSKVSSGLQAELTQVQADLASGAIAITSPTQPKR